MTRKEALADLIAKVEAGWPPDVDTPYMPPFNAVFGISWISKSAWDACNGSLDAAEALHEAVLCSDDPQYGYMVGPMYARIVHPSCGTVCDANSNTPARAWLLAILRALHRKDDAE